MWDLKNGTFESIRGRLHDLLCAFAILKGRIYGHAILLQLTLFRFWETHGHPAMTLLSENPEILIGDNIEVCNSLLAQHSSSNSRRIDAKLLDSAYTHLHHGRGMKDDIEKTINLHKGTNGI